MQSYVYEVTNHVTGMKYIGAKTGSHLKPYYLGSSSSLKADVIKYGRENFSIRIVKEFNDRESAFDYEKQLINELGADEDPMYYNSQPGGSGKDLVGRTAIHKGEENRIVTNDELEKYLSSDWELGFSPELQERFISTCGTGTRWMNNGEYSARIKPEDIPYFSGQGFGFGLLTHKNAGRIRITNDEGDNHLILEEDLPEWKSRGYYRGYHRKTDGYKRIHKGEENKLVPEDELESYYSEGWEPGYHYNRRKKS